MGVIGKRMKESGLEDIWQESNFYGGAVKGNVLERKHYYRGERGHRTTLEALERMRFQKFLEFWRSKENSHFSELIEQVNNLKRDIRNLFRKHPFVCWRNNEEISNKISELPKIMEDLFALFEEFIELGKSKSEVFEFWDYYVEMVYLLQKFIAAECNSNWQEYLAASVEMVSYDRAFDHIQCFRWGIICPADMINLPTSALHVSNSFLNDRNHCISRSLSISYFNAVSTDMALEQSQIKESKSAGGILGISQDCESCEQWALTRHLKSFVSTSFIEMSGISEDTGYHNELRLERIKKMKKMSSL